MFIYCYYPVKNPLPMRKIEKSTTNKSDYYLTQMYKSILTVDRLEVLTDSTFKLKKNTMY